MTTLVVLPAPDGQLPATTAELLGAAAGLGEPTDALVIGLGAGALASALPVRRALVADDASLSPYAAERWLPLAAAAVAQTEPGLVLLPHSLLGRELAPRLAFRLEAGLVT